MRAGPGTRPVLRPPAGAAPWVFTGGGEAQLVLDGLTVSGCDIVLRGSFDTVRITACTVDPGTAAEGSPPVATAVDGVPLDAEPYLHRGRSRRPGRPGGGDPPSCSWTTASSARSGRVSAARSRR